MNWNLLVALLLSLSLSACGTNPASLAAPAKVSCIHLKERMSYTATRGIVNYVWLTSLEPGLYISEKVDGEGTYFRGPSGALYVGSESAPGLSKTHDGGFWVPNDPKAPIRPYAYLSTASVPVENVPADIECSKAAYIRSPDSKGVSVVAMGAAGGLGGIAGRAMVPNSSLSYGQSAAAGVIAGGIIALLINAEAGNILLHHVPEDPIFAAQLRELANRAVVLQEVSGVASGKTETKQ